MAKNEKQKNKLMCLLQILMENTDDNHCITMPQIVKELENRGIKAERKSLYSDIKALREMDVDVIGEREGRTFKYHIASRQFQLVELKLLVDAIQSSKFITAKKSNELIKKLETLTSVHEAKQLQRQVYVSGRVKTMNESIYYNVDDIHGAISNNKVIRFQYYRWNEKKERELRKDGAFYEVSPWGLSWDDENYYMIGYDSKAEQIKHYRVDKMLNISQLDNKREGKEHFDKFDMADYSKKSFGMFSGKDEHVKLLCSNEMANVIIDRFGKNIIMAPADDGYFTTFVNVAVSEPFLGWIFALGDKVKIVSPQNVVEKMKEMTNTIIDMYKE